ncbi:energy-coupling factor transport system ATP-binding protein [Rhodococcus wratislaviensis]|uniref:ABC transporter ATPase n=1 Tax=Rhodococcus wratislaviensis TaxID=44752 RepID=A0AB38FD27_RHOWR|nr:energy-coupling factor ABC transporter ATP-binding protein [Rhodococcus wratislaviensis]REE75464.1 energy-coupling factor transport system ATP-binding protein [Rhodococcus wratislaviensis]SPZ39502.1 ABC transporter ATPase [Rhodococcus wratislaviensis]
MDRTLDAEPRPTVNVPATTDPALTLDNVEHVYNNTVRALDGVSLDIMRGDFLAIIGKNGSGKTTLAKHFNGLLAPTNTAGTVRVHRRDGTTIPVEMTPLHKMASTVGYVLQNPDRQIFHDTCFDELAFGPRNLGVDEDDIRRRVEQTLHSTGLSGHEQTNPVHLSRGQRQRLAIAATLTMHTEIVVIDEPTTGQDRGEARLILDCLAECHRRGTTIVIISHDMALVAEYATRIVAMRNGSVLADGTPRQVFGRTDVLETTNIRPPQVTLLGTALGHPGWLTVTDAVTGLRDTPAPKPHTTEAAHR